jgi:hypothetical protein
MLKLNNFLALFLIYLIICITLNSLFEIYIDYKDIHNLVNLNFSPNYNIPENKNMEELLAQNEEVKIILSLLLLITLLIPY